MKEQIVLSFDLGKRSGWYSNCENFGKSFNIQDLRGLYSRVIRLIEDLKPNVIIYPVPTRYHNVMRKHYQYIGIINLVAEKKEIQTIEVIDSQAKKVVLGKGKASKQEIMDEMRIQDSEIADAKMFTIWYLKSIKKV